MKSSIHLFRPQWRSKSTSYADLYVIGWAEYESVVYDTERLLELTNNKYGATDTDEFKKFLLNLNGNFSMIIHSESSTILCVDKLRCFPVLYFQRENCTYVTDDIDVFRQKYPEIKFTVNEEVIEQYFCSNFIFGPYTIYRNVYSVQGGEFVEIVDEQYVHHQYFRWVPNMGKDSPRALSQESSTFDALFTRVIQRMIQSAPNARKWVVPLSGGHDSRLIVNYLYKGGVKNVICYTYGLRNQETIISEAVAKALGYDWYFIEYTAGLVAEMQQSKEIEGYRKYAFNGTSVPHLQDFIATYMLKKMGIVETGDVFVPGHTHDFLTGSHLACKADCSDTIYSSIPFMQRHFQGFGYAKRSATLIQHVVSIVDKYHVHPNQITECLDWQERQSKFIVNSVRVYEYFGFDWRIPAWDNEVISYWKNVGYNYRYGRNLSYAMEKALLLVEPLRLIPFAGYLKAKKPYKTRIAESISMRLKKVLRAIGYCKSQYYDPSGLHLVYSDKQETVFDYLTTFSAPDIVRKYLSVYPKNMQLRYFHADSVSTLLIIKETIRNGED